MSLAVPRGGTFWEEGEGVQPSKRKVRSGLPAWHNSKAAGGYRGKECREGMLARRHGGGEEDAGSRLEGPWKTS